MRSRSFTLIEMLIALALIASLVWVLMPATNRIMTSTTAAADRSHRLAQIALLSDVLDRALLTAVAQDAEGKNGTRGDAESFRVTTCGVSLMPREPGQPDDLQSIEVAFSGDAIKMRQDGGSQERLIDGIESCRFEYYSGGSWSESFDGGEGLPQAVAVSVWLGAAPLEPDEESDPLGYDFEEESERDPDWRRVFAVFDPGAQGEQTDGGAL